MPWSKVSSSVTGHLPDAGQTAPLTAALELHDMVDGRPDAFARIARLAFEYQGVQTSQGLLGAVAVQRAQGAIMAGVGGGFLVYNVRDGYARALEWLNPLIDLSLGMPSFFRQTSGGASLRAAIWIACAGAAVFARSSTASELTLRRRSPSWSTSRASIQRR